MLCVLGIIKFFKWIWVLILGIACVLLQAKVVCYGYNKFLVPLGFPAIAWKVILGILILWSTIHYKMHTKTPEKELQGKFFSAIIFLLVSYAIMRLL